MLTTTAAAVAAQLAAPARRFESEERARLHVLAPFQNRSHMSVEHVSPRSVQVRGSNWYLGGARALGDKVGPHSTIISTPGKIDS